MKTKIEVLQSKLDGWIAKNSPANERELELMVDEADRLTDYIKLSPSFRFHDAGEGRGLLMGFQDGAHFKEFNLSEHALRQLSERNNIPSGYLKGLAWGNDWQRELAIRILSDHNTNKSRERLLIRSVGDDIKAVLSDQYRRLNSIKLFMDFLEAGSKNGLVLGTSHHAFTRSFMEMYYPEVLSIETPNNGEVVLAFGVQYRTSDYGAGATELRAMTIHLVCLNGATGQSVMKQIHLGSRLPENIELSQKTYDLDSAATSSLLVDAMGTLVSPTGIEGFKEKIRTSSNKLILNPQEFIGSLPKMGMTMNEVSQTENYLMNSREEDGLTGKLSLFKFAQAIGAVARDTNAERSRELYEIAGNLMLN